MRSDQIKVGHDRAPHRALLKAAGVTDADMGKPFIGIANSYIDIVPGYRLKIKVDTKGGGSENMSQLTMLPPSAGWEGARQFIVETVAAAGPNACPPLVVGVGIGGNFDKCALLAKKALLRHVGEPNPDPAWAEREQEVLAEINKLGVGPMGLGGTVTALAVHIETMGCHITALPVAVNIECHSHRHKEAVL